MTDDPGEETQGLEAPLTEKTIPDNAKKIFSCIAKDESVTKKEIRNELEISYQLLNYHINQLREKYLIREAGFKEMERGPKRPVYESTIAGFLYSYSQHPDNSQIQKEGEERVPLVLGKMEHFEEHGIDYIIIPSFKEYSGEMWGYYAYELSKKSKDTEEEVVRKLAKDFYRNLLSFGSTRNFLWRRATGTQHAEVAQLGRVLVADEELMELTQPIISGLHDVYGNLAKVYAEIEKEMKRKEA